MRFEVTLLNLPELIGTVAARLYNDYIQRQAPRRVNILVLKH